MLLLQEGGLTRLVSFILYLLCRLALSLPATASGSSECYSSTGVAQFCQPDAFPDIVMSPILSVSANSECGVNGLDRFRAFGRNGAIALGICDSNANHQLLASHLTSSGNRRWQSKTLANASVPVVLSLQLSRALLVTSLSIGFTFTSPARMRVALLSAGTNTSRTVAEYARDCSAIAGTTPCTNLSSDVLSITLQLANLTVLATSSGESERQDIRDRFLAQRVDIIMDQVGYPAALSPSGSLAEWIYYAIDDIAMSAACDCSGHAANCSLQSAECQCQHATQGAACTQCLASYSGLPWRQAIPGNASGCVDADECARTADPCGGTNTTECINLQGSFRCQCVDENAQFDAGAGSCAPSPAVTSTPATASATPVTNQSAPQTTATGVATAESMTTPVSTTTGGSVASAAGTTTAEATTTAAVTITVVTNPMVTTPVVTTTDSVTTAPVVTTDSVTTIPMVTTDTVTTIPMVTTDSVTTAPMVTTDSVTTIPMVTTDSVTTAPMVTTDSVTIAPVVTTDSVTTIPMVTTDTGTTIPMVTTDSVTTAPMVTTDSVTITPMVTTGTTASSTASSTATQTTDTLVPSAAMSTADSLSSSPSATVASNTPLHSTSTLATAGTATSHAPQATTRPATSASTATTSVYTTAAATTAAASQTSAALADTASSVSDNSSNTGESTNMTSSPTTTTMADNGSAENSTGAVLTTDIAASVTDGNGSHTSNDSAQQNLFEGPLSAINTGPVVPIVVTSMMVAVALCVLASVLIARHRRKSAQWWLHSDYDNIPSDRSLERGTLRSNVNNPYGTAPSHFKFISPTPRENGAVSDAAVTVANPSAVQETSPRGIREMRQQGSFDAFADECELATTSFSFREERLTSVSEEADTDSAVVLDAYRGGRSHVGNGAVRHTDAPLAFANLTALQAERDSHGTGHMDAPTSPESFQTRRKESAVSWDGDEEDALSEARSKRLTHLSLALGVHIDLGVSDPNLCEQDPVTIVLTAPTGDVATEL